MLVSFIRDKCNANSYKLKIKLGKAKCIAYKLKAEGCKLYYKIV
jgi:hypothetical protein